jgi:hypothetical protein
MADGLAEEEINCQNFRYSRPRPNLASASAAKDDRIVVVMVVVVKAVEQFVFGEGRGQSSSDGI